MELDPTLADGFSARGYATVLLGLDIDAALRDFARAQELAPSAPNGASWSSRVLARRGEIEQAYVEARRARDLDPLAAGRHIALSALALQAGDYAQAIESARVARGLEPSLARAAAYEARALLLAGRPDECLALDLGAHRLVRALCLQEAGRGEEAATLIAEAEAAYGGGAAADPNHLEDVVAAELAAFYAWVGDAAEAERWVREAYTISPVGLDPRVVGSGIFGPLRDDGSFWSAFAEAEGEARARLLTG